VPLPGGLGEPKRRLEGLERLDGLGGFDGLTAGIVAVASDERGKIHTFGGPRRRPCLDKGRGRRIKNGSSFDLMWDSPNFIVTIPNSSPFSWVLHRNHSQLIGLWHCLRMDQGEG
jgi:hypothetical protein